MSENLSDNALVRRLASTPYEAQDQDFIRFRDSSVDDDVRSVIVAITSAEESERERVRAALTPEAVETLLLFAKRRTLQARRRSSMNLVDETMDALALVPEVRDVPWDTWLKGSLFIARSLGCDLEAIGVRFGELSTELAAQRFDVAFEAMSRVDALAQCFLDEVTTTYGTGFVETLVHRDTAATGTFYSAPRQADDVVAYEPTTNLAQLAASLADAFDATNKLRTDALTQDQLAGMSFSQQVPGAYLETRGCLSFYADALDGAFSFKVFVAELPDAVDVDELAEGASGDGQAVAFDDHQLILFVAPPNFGDDDDVDFDFEEYVALAQQTLRDSKPAGWHTR